MCSAHLLQRALLLQSHIVSIPNNPEQTKTKTNKTLHLQLMNDYNELLSAFLQSVVVYFYSC